MKQKKIFHKKKRLNISFRRKIALIYTRVMLIIKVMIAILLYLFFFTQYFASIKLTIRQNIYELTADIGFTLENVLIEGQKHLPEIEILSALNGDKGTPIFALNLYEIKNNLAYNPWVKDVMVARKLPNTIYISLLERVPIAIWQINQQIFLIDEEGYKITKNIERWTHLLHVVGPDANIYASKLMKDLAKYPELTKNITSSVRYGGRRWNLNFEQNITVKMPEINFEKSLNYIARLNKENKFFNQNYKIIDLRDASKYYIEKY